MNSFFTDLKDFQTVLVAGSDAARFLQGQLTCDVHALADNELTYGAACNNKGRVFAAFILARHGADFHVLFQNGLAGTFIANLQKFIPFYKCSMQILPAQKAIGLSVNDIINFGEILPFPLPPANSASEHAGIRLYNIRADSSQFILATNNDTYATMRANIESASAEAPYEKWQLQNMLSGHFPFSMEDVEKYTPQDLHLDETGYVSFTKGCYTGQEIIARMHYRGKLKKRLYVLQTANFETSHSGIEIFDDSDNALGSSMKQIADNGSLFALSSLPVNLTASLHTKAGNSISYKPLIERADPNS